MVQEDAEDEDWDKRHYGFQVAAHPVAPENKTAHLEVIRQA